MRRVVRKGVNSYKACALLFFNTLVVFAVFNLVLFAAYQVRDAIKGRSTRSDRVVDTLKMSALKRVYPGYTDHEIHSLVKETWERGVVFDPATLFRERPHKGKWVNVSQHGFRLTKDNGPWPPDAKNLNVFLFGGSTTFGCGLPDEQTIASHLQQFLCGQCDRQVKVYNFGCCFFVSSQERASFLSLLAEGAVPHVAIFIDGLNEFCFYSAELMGTADLRKLVDAPEPKLLVAGRSLLAALPMQRLISAVQERVGRNPGENQKRSIDSYNNPDSHTREELSAVLSRYSRNRRLIAAAARGYGIHTAFVWQPIPNYHYDLSYHLFGRFETNYTKFGYIQMASAIKENPQDYASNFLWLADIQENEKLPLYVDGCHYTGEFSRVIAHHIGRFLLDRGMIESGNPRSDAASTVAQARERCADHRGVTRARTP